MTDDTTQKSGRLPDDTPITQAELVAITKALQHWNSLKKPGLVVIHTDSKSSIQIFQNKKLNTYPTTVKALLRHAEAINKRGRHSFIHWVPSHMGIKGNERADALANAAIHNTEINPAEITAAKFAGKIQTFIHQTTLNPIKPPPEWQAQWYKATTLEETKILQNRLCDVQIRNLRCASYHTDHVIQKTCQVCEEPLSPAHYLVMCPGLPALRAKIMKKINPTLLRLRPSQLASILIRRAALEPTLFYELFSKHPFHYSYRRY